jgi:hypothetical protein
VCAQVATYPLQGENPNFPMAGAGIAFGKNDMLYVGSLQQGVLRFDVDNPGGPQEHYASALPDLPTCSTVAAGTPCSPTAIDRRPTTSRSRTFKTAAREDRNASARGRA